MPRKNKEEMKAYQAEYIKKHYQENKQYYIQKAREARVRRSAYVRGKKEVPCFDCKMRYPFYVMDFDHKPEFKKEHQMNNIINGASYATIDKEIAKCDVVCSNCHRFRTFSRLYPTSHSS